MVQEIARRGETSAEGLRVKGVCCKVSGRTGNGVRLEAGKADGRQGLLAHPCVDWSSAVEQLHDLVVLLANPYATARAALLACCPFARLLSREQLVCLEPVQAVSLNSMASSPLSDPGISPRTASPLPAEEPLARSFAVLQDDAHMPWALESAPAVAMREEAPSGMGASGPDETATAAKGKEKAAKGPLKLLDLPMDILKEIIHQVSTGRPEQHGARCHG